MGSAVWQRIIRGAEFDCLSRSNNFFDVARHCSHCWPMAVRQLVFLGAFVYAASATFAAEDAVGFGFSGPETFPIDAQISQLHGADIDGDGLKDLVVVNNARSR